MSRCCEFVKVIGVLGPNEEGLQAIGLASAVFAQRQGLMAHAGAMRRRSR